MLTSQDSAAGVRFWQIILIVFLLLGFLNGCANLRHKQVTPPPPKKAVSRPPAGVPGAMVKNKYPVARTPTDERYIKPHREGRPLTKQPPLGERPVVTRPPIEEGSPERYESQVEERPLASPPVEEHAVVVEPPIAERPISPPEEETPAEEPAEDAGFAHHDPPADYKPVTGKASAIYDEAEEAMQAGNYSSAELLLERALRIEPRNAHYWYILGLAKFRQKQYPQTVQLCLKAESLAGSQPGLLARNRVLLTQAKKAAGMK